MKKALFILCFTLSSVHIFSAAHEKTSLIQKELTVDNILFQINVQRANIMHGGTTYPDVKQKLEPKSYEIFWARSSNNSKNDLLQLLSRATADNWNPVYLEVIERYIKDLKDYDSCAIQ